MKPTKLPPPTFSGGPTLEDFLEKIMPKIKTHADRMKLYRKFLYEQHLEHDYNNNDVDFFNGPAMKLTPEEAEKKAVDDICKQREEGVTDAEQIAREFAKWNSRQKKERLSQRGKKGAIARHSKVTQKKSEKNGSATDLGGKPKH